MAFDLLFKPVIAVPVLLIAIYITYSKLTAKSTLPDLPWIGVKNQSFSKLRARLSSFKDFRAMLDYSNEEYSKKGLSCILPMINGECVLLPPSYTDWIINQPDDVLNVKEVHRQALQTEYTMAHPVIVQHPFHEDVVRRDLTRQLGSLTEEIMDELAAGFDQYWGMDTEDWKEICVWEDTMKIIAMTSNRIFVGLPLCRNDDYLNNAAKYSQDVPFASAVINLFPTFTHPLVGRLFTLPGKYHIRKCTKYIEPLLQERLLQLDRKERDPEHKYEEPNDFLQWSIRYAREHLPASEMSSTILGGRLLAVNFAAIHTSSIGITNTIFDLISTPPEKGYLEGIREEAERVLAEDNGTWTKAGLAKMVRVDSAIRESLRQSSFLSRGLVRKVVADEGVTLEDGLHLKKGTLVGMSAYSVHTDKAVHSNPNEYDAFRFSRPREAFEKSAKAAVDTSDAKSSTSSSNDAVAEHHAEILKHKNLSMVTTSESFLTFGHGRHACPGRFFAANELKLLMAYIALNYDIEPIAVRPPNSWMGEVVLPPMKATIRIRRKKGTVKA